MFFPCDMNVHQIGSRTVHVHLNSRVSTAAAYAASALYQ